VSKAIFAKRWKEHTARRMIEIMGIEGLRKWLRNLEDTWKLTIVVETSDGREILLEDYLDQLEGEKE